MQQRKEEIQCPEEVRKDGALVHLFNCALSLFYCFLLFMATRVNLVVETRDTSVVVELLLEQATLMSLQAIS